MLLAVTLALVTGAAALPFVAASSTTRAGSPNQAGTPPSHLDGPSGSARPVGTRPSGEHPAPTTTAPGPARSPAEVVAAANVVLSDFPAGWRVDRSATSLVGGFLDGATTGGPPPTRAHTPAAAALGQFESCLGVSGSAGPFFARRSSPLAGASSPVFQDGIHPGAPEAGSQVVLFKSGPIIRAFAAEISRAGFGGCLGQALGATFVSSVRSSVPGSTVTFHATVLDPRKPTGGVAGGVDLSVAVATGPRRTVVDLGIVALASGDLQADLFTSAQGTAFPASLRTSLVAALDKALQGAS